MVHRGALRRTPELNLETTPRSRFLKSRFLLTPLVLALSLASPGQTLPPTPAPESTDQLVQQALESNPEIRVAVRRLSLAQIKTSTAGSLDDPMLMVRDWNTPLRQPWNLNQAQVMVGLQQTFVGRDKREMRARIAGDEANIAAVELETMRQEIAAEVRKACADLKRSAENDGTFCYTFFKAVARKG